MADGGIRVVHRDHRPRLLAGLVSRQDRPMRRWIGADLLRRAGEELDLVRADSEVSTATSRPVGGDPTKLTIEADAALAAHELVEE